MSVPKFQQMSFVFASLICAALMVSTAGYAQETETDVDKRLQQLEKLEKSGLYSEEQIAEAKRDLLQSIVNPAAYSGGEYGDARISRPGASARRAENELYEAYRERLRDRREQALALRREYMFYRPPARGWLAIRAPFPTTMANMFELGRVRQPPISFPRQRIIVVPSYDDYRYDDYPYYEYGNRPPRL
jgi:hypothetical protein